MTQTIEIVPVKLEELPQLSELAKVTYTETFGDHMTKKQLDDFFEESYSLSVLEKVLNDSESIVRFLKVNGDIAGYLKLNWGKSQTEHELEDAFEIQRIYILRQYQGHGLGNKLFQYAMEKAYESKKSWAWLGVWEHNIKAQGLYRKNGFERFSEHHFITGDLVETDWLMKKSLK
ncbi:hypothetical protein HMPREF9318_00184 [Streptococcus urinalis FB127-CNA-2]|uniref:Acetyltransferase, GNAT family n=1 Tax=Streptococcus urinalis 2285-97 TaxID=764291 RepID=G5KF19_9STRE|nr:N-acetyltransferase [Streptococcus urinalis]EHJ55959.1 acetyltransferase, GNAT family [Streptococcus urinalis 2285-97]EKS21986.1 hypothetical protein HMPREF9318_00184 [Streptococcus urinalis FB127-CNA-2]VEF31798.1 GNAT family acetyltransferase [Streptococcus urinalis]